MENLEKLNSGVKEFFNTRAEKFNNNFLDRQNKAKSILDLHLIKGGEKVLDIACGTGVLEDVLLQFGVGEIVAIDISENMIEYAKQLNTSEKVTFLATDIYSFTGSGFDTAIIYSAYPHLLDKAKLVQKLNKVLKAGGRFIIMHSTGYKSLNEMHSSLNEKLYLPLKPAKKECKIFESCFDIDVIIDTEERYVISGVKK